MSVKQLQSYILIYYYNIKRKVSFRKSLTFLTVQLDNVVLYGIYLLILNHY